MNSLFPCAADTHSRAHNRAQARDRDEKQVNDFCANRVMVRIMRVNRMSITAIEALFPQKHSTPQTSDK